MKQLTLSVPENKLKFFYQFLKSLEFVKIEKEVEPSKAEILHSIERGLKEVELIRQGKLPKKSIDQLLYGV
ncbi:MAG: hypothetical protein ABIT08_15425 [Bacteroidia bacterium]